MKEKVFYVAHPLGKDHGERLLNMEKALRWLHWLITRHQGIAFMLPWYPYCMVLEETPENRQRGLRDDTWMLKRCDGIVLCGGRLSPGMEVELAEARQLNMEVIDLLELGPEPPSVES